jgi:penicillin-binding protein 1A
MMTLLRAVTRMGTGAAAAQLNHPLGGKTGTTSDFTDAWFLGFSPSVTCGVWVGYDSNQSLGEKETGAKAALPIWITVMRAAIAGKDDEQFLGDKETPPIEKVVKPPAKLVTAPGGSKMRVAPALPPRVALPPTQPAVKPRVKPALPPLPAPAKPVAR